MAGSGDEDLIVLSQYKWFAHIRPRKSMPDKFEAVRNDRSIPGTTKIIRMHRVIMSALEGLEVDHINGNPLDNRKINLRLCKRWQNAQNRSYPERDLPRGVYLQKRTGKFVASIRIQKRYIHLGTFDTPERAAVAYDSAVMHHYGEFAITNI